VTRSSVQNPPGRRPSWSSWLAVAAVGVAVVAGLFAPPPFNGLSLAAVVLGVLALIVRGLETYNRTKEDR
jgi:drug/metabolite transporter (DMT)-like permease